MTKKQFMALATGLFISIVSTHVFSQEHHYWSHQFGSRSALMGGAVVGGVRDTSAGFYNPGALGFVGESSFSVSANGYKLDWVEIDNGVGTGESLESQEIQNIPLLISGTFEFGNHTFGYSLLNKNLSAIKMSGRLELNEDLVPSTDWYGNPVVEFDGPEEYRGQFLYNSKVDELWGGLSWANQVSPILSLGISGFLALRNQNFYVTQAGRAANQNSLAVASEDLFLHNDFWNVRGLLKLGLAADLERIKLGATLTTPSISLFGRGNIGGGLSFFNFGPEAGNEFIGDDRQEDLEADYKTPLSLSVGLEYLISQQTRISGTIEWFAKRSRYNVMTPQPKSFLVGLVGVDLSQLPANIRDSFDSQFLLKTEDAAESIVNFALAIE